MMMRTFWLMLLSVLVLRTEVAEATGIPCVEITVTTAAGEPVSVFCLPDGSGLRLDDAWTFGGGRTDATITVTLMDCSFTPIAQFPFEDVWLASESGGLYACPGGTVADANTDANGQTWFTRALLAGGSSDHAGDERAQVLINGDAWYAEPMPIYFNSPDLNGDLAVNLTDISLFAWDYYYGEYDYRSDFYWDGVLNLTDISLLAQGAGVNCP